jgi:hypothetical protein
MYLRTSSEVALGESSLEHSGVEHSRAELEHSGAKILIGVVFAYSYETSGDSILDYA